MKMNTTVEIVGINSGKQPSKSIKLKQLLISQIFACNEENHEKVRELK